MASTSCLLMVRPRPVPPYFRVVEPSTWVKRSKIAFLPLLGDADARILHGELDRDLSFRFPGRFQADQDLTLAGELDGISHQV